ncbi:Lrp/AsnC family transcriptional regulator [Deminuibacter soli]|uniref:Lrp/AsnC family transcriptional regulator n=1 Tax=Deminuibacter soli TaxID=2291815 RepID=A0A3E1NE58_9BACT|nr:Lrp/AsnC family transcriptional regulator [Deminuibacter soli]RFM26246.1 Lrp/AsnC family transcriptional regulator [Deminuibacter soli]
MYVFKLDDKDLSILRLLQQDAKITVREIAARLHLTTTPVHERIRRMEEQGVIKQYVALVDHTKVNKGLIVFCHVSLKEHTKQAGGLFLDTINGFAQITECYNISGSFDFMLKIVVADMEEYHQFYVDQLGETPGISHMQSSFVMGIMKYTMQLV